MRRALLCSGFVVALATSLLADSNLRIEDVGLDGYWGKPAVMRLVVRNPSAQEQSIHLRVAATSGETNTVTSDFRLNGGEERRLELPVLIPPQKTTITADASAGGSVFGHDSHEGSLGQDTLIVMMCGSENARKAAQSQIEFSGNLQERAQKNRDLKFVTVDDARDDWWAYSAGSAIVLARPLTTFTAAQRDALEGYLRSGGRLVLLESEIGDAGFLSAYRQAPAPATGERVGLGTLFRVSGLDANTLGDVFSGHNLPASLNQVDDPWGNAGRTDLLPLRFAATFTFPRLRWMLLWLAAYILIIGIVNFAVLRRLRRLDYGWISVCALALVFAAGFYFSSASSRPREFRLDNLATYYLDGRSPLASADYNLRLSAPSRREVRFSINDPAVFPYSNLGNNILD